MSLPSSHTQLAECTVLRDLHCDREQCGGDVMDMGSVSEALLIGLNVLRKVQLVR